MKHIDNYSPKGKWTFDADITRVFEDMLQRSIPGYSTMRDCVVRLAKPTIESDYSTFAMLDIGCSRGDTIYEVLDSLERPEAVKVVGIDSSQPMIETAKELLGHWENVEFVLSDVRDVEITPGTYTLVTSILTAQFVPLDERQKFFDSVYSGLSYDGAFIIVEKILGETMAGQDILVDAYTQYKRDKGYTMKQIEEKRKSLQGVLVPLRASENERMLKDAGFADVQRFWQCLNFAGWIAKK